MKIISLAFKNVVNIADVTDMSPDSSDVTGMMTDAVNDRQEFNASLVCR